MQLIIHSPFGSRVNRAWGLPSGSASAGSSTSSSRPRRPRTLAALAGPQHSFPLDSVFRFLHPDTVRES